MFSYSRCDSIHETENSFCESIATPKLKKSDQKSPQCYYNALQIAEGSAPVKHHWSTDFLWDQNLTWDPVQNLRSNYYDK